MGRPTKYTPKRVKTVLECLKEGLSLRGTCMAAGIHTSTYYEWREQYPKFSIRCDEAIAEGERELLAKAKKETRGAQWLLSRRWPEDYGQRVELGGDIAINIKFDDDQGISSQPESAVRRTEVDPSKPVKEESNSDGKASGEDDGSGD